LYEYESHCYEKVIREEWLRNEELQPQVTMLNARFKRVELRVYVQSLQRKREFPMGKRMVILARSLQREKKVLLRKESWLVLVLNCPLRLVRGSMMVMELTWDCNCSYCTY